MRFPSSELACLLELSLFGSCLGSHIEDVLCVRHLCHINPNFHQSDFNVELNCVNIFCFYYDSKLITRKPLLKELLG